MSTISVDPITFVIYSGFLVIVTVIVSNFMRRAVGLENTGAPKVVVNMPDMDKLPSNTEVITPQEAVLWWTVYERTFESEDSDDAIYAANEAVDKVFRSGR